MKIPGCLLLTLAIPWIATGVPAEADAAPQAAKTGTPGAGAAKAKNPRPGNPASGSSRKAAVSTIEAEALEGFESYPPKIQQLVRNALALTRQELTYTFGSADPERGGMDCSGTIFHLLSELGIDGVPRQSDQICGWVKQRAALHRITQADALTDAEFKALQPGDLLFWSNTYRTAPREIPVSHVMLYLGRNKATGKHVVFGASDGRSYEGQRRTGVSVFDFTLPKPGQSARFYGYGRVPGIGGGQPAAGEHVIASTTANAGTAAPSEPLEEIRRAETVSVPSDTADPGQGAVPGVGAESPKPARKAAAAATGSKAS